MSFTFIAKIKTILLIAMMIVLSQGRPLPATHSTPCKSQCIDIGNKYCTSFQGS